MPLLPVAVAVVVAVAVAVVVVVVVEGVAEVKAATIPRKFSLYLILI